ncbi:MAG: glycerophosphodiester phosphodiesterase family protein [Desulfobacteraceae bacterium]|jgi:glycerophosphoryl diester phosphodiesterase|nr:glycerophosphodiester phosphodiesterase family protein [Desulfobacteraceae bacterium]MDD3991062.1 glycerophosphodiester phosphodiesterase family protein [Desulfobacteraceae bacterium]
METNRGAGTPPPDRGMRRAVRKWMETAFQRLADRYVRVCAVAPPLPDRLAAARIVSHRGEYDNRRVFENTLAAFDRADRANVWGLELDLRWTADLQPVVFHDPDLGRMAGVSRRLADLRLAEARSFFPPLATLAEVVARYGGRRHLMIEIKAEPYRRFHTQMGILAATLAPLRPVDAYHLLSLDPGMFAYCGFSPLRAMLPIAWADVKTSSRLALARGYGGVCGHFLLVGNKTMKRHQHWGQQVGCGMVNSEKGLYREIRRGTDWIFSDRAAGLAAACRKAGSGLDAEAASH